MLPVEFEEKINPFPLVIFSPLFANAANNEFPLTSSAETAPSGVAVEACPSLISLLEAKVKIDDVSLRTASPEPVPSHNKVSD